MSPAAYVPIDSYNEFTGFFQPIYTPFGLLRQPAITLKLSYQFGDSFHAPEHSELLELL
jgi:hypothetical protein